MVPVTRWCHCDQVSPAAESDRSLDPEKKNSSRKNSPKIMRANDVIGNRQLA